MEELFRFVMARPAQRVDVPLVTIPLTPSDPFRDRLGGVVIGDNPRGAFHLAAHEQRRSDETPDSIRDLAFGLALERFGGVLTDIDTATLAELGDIITAAFRAPAPEVVAARGFLTDRNAVSDVLITNAILGDRGVGLRSEEAANILRRMDIVRRVAAGDATLAQPGAVREARERTLVYPADIFPLGRVRPGAPPRPDPGKPDDDILAELIARRNELFAAYAAVTRLNPEHVAGHEPPPAGGGGGGGGVLLPGGVLAGHPPILPPAGLPDVRDNPLAADPIRHLAAAVKPGAGGQRGIPFMLRPEAAAGFPPPVQAVFAARGIDPTRTSLNSVVGRLSAEMLEYDTAIAARRTAAIGIVPFGGAFFTKRGLGGLVEPNFGDIGDIFGDPEVPMTHGTITPVGVGDLLVVRQFLKRYEARELAHIENILRGESKERIHRRARTTEETFTVETELKKEEERDQQTTERFELKTEASSIQKQDESFKAGLTVSGSYGPMIEFTATSDFALNHSREESTKVATSYSKDVTSRASSKVLERRREERILKTIEVFEETNTHGIDNTGQADHLVGQYQWIDKIYEAQVFNYGKRMLFDIMLPEPGAFLLYAAAAQPQVGVDLVKPPPFTIAATDLNEFNYAYYAQTYQAVGIEAPPEPLVTVGKALEGQGTGASFEGLKTAEVAISTGYEAISATLIYTSTAAGGLIADISVGEFLTRSTDTAVSFSFPMNNEVGNVPVTYNAVGVGIFSLGLEILCRCTQRELTSWKLKTYTMILQGYQKQLRDYEEALAARKVEAAQQIQGRNPVENERMIRNELKKGAISVFTAQHYDLFGAIANSPQGFPQPNLPVADLEGRYIRFFEQAFEWEQMMYFFYPYYWGRKNNWQNRALLQDPDPLFADFIRAGAARLVIPVRPAFEAALAHFMDTGEVWDGGDLPAITSPLYLGIIEEIRDRDRAPGEEEPQGDPWDVRLPTTLVRLRNEAALPAWQKNAEGEWVPV